MHVHMSIDAQNRPKHTDKFTKSYNFGLSFFAFVIVLILGTACQDNNVESSRKLLVGTAASLENLFIDLAADFETKHETDLVLVVSASGSLAHQIKSGAPLDLFVSANKSISDGVSNVMVLENSRHTFAYGKLALVSSLNFETPMAWRDVVLDDRVEYISIPNPELAPYGAKAIEILRNSEIYPTISKRIVFSSNVSNSLQFVKSGNAQVGFIALSQFHSGLTEGLNIWEVTDCSEGELGQTILINKSTLSPALARSFATYLKSNASNKIIESFGYSLKPFACGQH